MMVAAALLSFFFLPSETNYSKSLEAERVNCKLEARKSTSELNEWHWLTSRRQEDRRAFLVSGAATITALCFQQDAGARNLSFDEAVEILGQYCPAEFRQAVRQSGGCLLYRGEAIGDSPTILAPEPDLLIPSTYDDSQALEYFQCLEKQLANVDARPSKGHIGTADRADAEPWGTPVSVWPLGNRISYVWPKTRKLIYPGGDCPKDKDLVVNHGLSTALREGKEVLFASMPVGLCSKPFSSFLAISASYDDDLREILL